MLTAYSTKPLARHFEEAPKPRPTMTMAQMAKQENARMKGGNEWSPFHDGSEKTVDRVFKQLMKNDSMTTSELARNVGRSKDAVSKAANRLIKSGMATRRRDKDRGQGGNSSPYIYTLTEKGRVHGGR